VKTDGVEQVPGSSGGGNRAATFLEVLLDTVFSFVRDETRGLKLKV
jgi:hypothetical protein